MKYWVFDLDGTLTDSFGQYFSIVEELLQRQVSSSEKKHFIGMHPSEVFKANLPAEAVKPALKFLQEKSEREAHLVPVYKNIPEICHWLRNNNFNLAVYTNRDLESAEMVLQHNDLRKYFDYVVSGNCVSKRKPDPEGLVKIQSLYSCAAHEVVMIGDHDHDVDVARSFGATSIRASWHNYWEHDICTRAHKQFFSSAEFYTWVQSANQ